MNGVPGGNLCRPEVNAITDVAGMGAQQVATMTPQSCGLKRWVKVSGVPGIPRQGGQAAASIHFSDGEVRKMQNFSARFARKVPISNFSRKARRKK